MISFLVYSMSFQRSGQTHVPPIFIIDSGGWPNRLGLPCGLAQSVSPVRDQKANGHDSAPEEKKPIIDQMTDMLATAAGALAETAVKTVATRAKKAVAKRTPTAVKKAAKRAVKAATPKKAKTSAGRKEVRTKKSAARVTKKKAKKSKR